jgi:hemerythrin superfamily protein
MGAMELLGQQHRELAQLLEKVKSSDRSEKISLLGKIAESITVHERLEQQHFYPLLRQNGMDAQVDRSLEGHLEARRLVSEILELKRSDPRLGEAITQLEGAVRRHAEEAEEQIFPQARERIDASALDVAGEEMRRAIGSLENEDLIAQAAQPPAQ